MCLAPTWTGNDTTAFLFLSCRVPEPLLLPGDPNHLGLGHGSGAMGDPAGTEMTDASIVWQRGDDLGHFAWQAGRRAGGLGAGRGSLGP